MAIKFPRQIGPAIDLAYELRAQRIEKQRAYEAEIEEMKADEKKLADHILNTFKKSEINGAKGAICTASMVPKTYFQPDTENGGWDKIYAWVKKTGAFEIFERRLSRSACAERWQSGEMIPGVKTFDTMELSLTKIASKK